MQKADVSVLIRLYDQWHWKRGWKWKVDHTDTANRPTIIFIKFGDFLMFYQIFLSPQAKRCAIITYKHGIYGLPHEFPNDLRIRMLGN